MSQSELQLDRSPLEAEAEVQASEDRPEPVFHDFRLHKEGDVKFTFPGKKNYRGPSVSGTFTHLGGATRGARQTGGTEKPRWRTGWRDMRNRYSHMEDRMK